MTWSTRRYIFVITHQTGSFLLWYSTTARSFFFLSQFCVLVDNFWLECRMTLIFSSAYSPTLKHDFRYPHHGLKMSRKFSRAVWISKTPPKTHSCLNFFQSNLPSNRLWGGMKSKKVPSAHVWGYIIALKYPKLTPFISTCRYDHKEVFQYMFGVGNSLEKFSHGPQRHNGRSAKHNFWAPQSHFYCKTM